MPDLRLVLCPRHTERSDGLVKTIEELAPGLERRSVRLAEKRTDPLPAGHVLLVDTIGELGRL